MSRQKIVAGNWKMNMTKDEGMALCSEVINMAKDETYTADSIIIAPPFPFIHPLGRMLEGSNELSLAAQNCHQNASGAYTGEVSGEILRSFGAEYVILGHSERRLYFGEDAELLAKKTEAALAAGLKVIFCCGESLEIREAGTHLSFVNAQIKDSLFHLPVEAWENIILAYEPVWAIGTGKTASAGQAQDMHAGIRTELAGHIGQEAADGVSILYGGSCKPSNAKEIFSGADVDGGLIGGAALKSRDFIEIAKSF